MKESGIYGIWGERRDGKEANWIVPPNMPMFFKNRKILLGVATQHCRYDYYNQQVFNFYICELGEDGYPIQETMELIEFSNSRVK